MMTVFFNDLNVTVRGLEKSMIIYNGLEMLNPVPDQSSTGWLYRGDGLQYQTQRGTPFSVAARARPARDTNS